MKTKLLIISFFAVASAAAHAQSIGELHNNALSAIISRFETSPVNFDGLYSFATEYAIEHNATLLPYNETKRIVSDYIVGKNNEQMLSAAKANNVVSKSLSIYIEKVVSAINQTPDASPDVVSARLSSLAESSEYRNLSTADKNSASAFNDVFGRSYQFWYDLNASRKCRVGCIICIAAVDAFWTAVTHNPVIGAIMSAASRCCGCGDCGPRVNCGT